ncbi:MAG: uroporphyrinogen decarboxylase [Deltaproteobacteria bacterium]|nr:uroporphyrinogen decarboxylase [Deltaproteobacteria bacterium]
MLNDSVLLKVVKGERTARLPVWFMRQAGRYLPEYRELRKRHRMLELISTPELAAKVTLQPIDRFDLDAAIIFADILNPLIGMGVKLDFVEGEGPKIFNPIASESDVDRLSVPDVKDSVGYTLEAIGICVKSLTPRGVPLIGFAGAPFTLSSYLIEQGGHSTLAATKHFMFSRPEAWHNLQQKLSTMIANYLIAQAEAGVSLVQIFDSWAGVLSEEQYREFALPYLQSIIAKVREATPIPIFYFSTGTGAILPLIKELGSDGISIDWRVPLPFARAVLGDNMVLQGNLDPLVLRESLDSLERYVRVLVEQGTKCGKYIFNLGHGILPDTPPENVARVIEIIRE